MALSRAIVLRNIRPRILANRAQPLRRLGRRTYASGGHHEGKSWGEPVWAAGALAVTVPATYYILSSAPTSSHGHGDHHDSHHEQDHDEGDEDAGDEAGKEQEDDHSEQSDEATEDAESSKDDDTSDDKETAKGSSGGAETVDDDEKNVRMHVPDAKGGAKARLQSKQALKMGTLNPEDEEDPSKPDDPSAPSKPAGSMNTQSGKQEGLTNTDTKHSVDFENHPEKSSKPDGGPETAKSKGTVDIRRPAK